jgi:hypothetical protein
MTTEQFEREKLYQATLAAARAMVASGLLTSDELAIVDALMIEKYRPVLGSLSALSP